MGSKLDKDEIVFGIIIIITVIVSFIVANKIGVSSRLVFCGFVAIEFGLFCLVKRISNKKTDENTNVAELKEEININPMQEMFDKMCDYCNKLEAANYDTYKIYFPPKTKEEIQTWEMENQITLPKGYKDWLLLSNGFDEIDGTQLYSLENICKHPFPEYGEYYIMGSYIGDGSFVVTDKNGVFYELDHVNGLEEITFEAFIARGVIETLENCMADAGI